MILKKQNTICIRNYLKQWVNRIMKMKFKDYYNKTI